MILMIWERIPRNNTGPFRSEDQPIPTSREHVNPTLIFQTPTFNEGLGVYGLGFRGLGFSLEFRENHTP